MPTAVTISDYASLRRALDARRRELGLTMVELDAVAGLAERYVPKLLGPGEVKRLGECSLSALLGALGGRLVATRYGEALELGGEDYLTLIRYQSLRQSLGIEITLEMKDALLPPVTRRAMEASVSASSAGRVTPHRKAA